MRTNPQRYANVIATIGCVGMIISAIVAAHGANPWITCAAFGLSFALYGVLTFS